MWIFVSFSLCDILYEKISSISFDNCIDYLFIFKLPKPHSRINITFFQFNSQSMIVDVFSYAMYSTHALYILKFNLQIEHSMSHFGIKFRLEIEYYLKVCIKYALDSWTIPLLSEFN